MRTLFVMITLFFVHSISAQAILEETVTISAKDQKSYDFPAKELDELMIVFEKVDGKKISKVELYNAEEEIIYMRFDVKDLKKKVIIKEAGLYRLVFINDEKKDYIGEFSVTLTAQDKKKRKISRKRVVETSYGYEANAMVAVNTLVTSTLQNDKFYLNSKSNALVKGGKSRVLLPVFLPEGTKEWYYVYTASRDEEQIKNTLNSFSLASELTGLIQDKKSLQQSVSSLSVPPGANISDIYLLDEKNASLFKEKKNFEYKIDDSRENFKSGIVHVKSRSDGKVYLGLNNPDNLHGIHVAIEVVAIVEETSQVMEKIRIPVYTSYTIPVIEEDN